jgi:carbonic anhydrase/acetyltransferase-like protein (isoleucine patch superfamily)
MKTSERLSRHLDKTPVIPDSCWIAGTASVYGDVVLGERCSVWPSAVIRGDINSIRIGDDTNIQDGAIVHLADEYGAVIGERVTVGHGAIVHACQIGDDCLIGMQATVLDGAEVGDGCIIGAHALVTQGMKVPPGSMVLGVPGKVVKTLSDAERAALPNWALKYVEVSRGFKERGLR